MMTPPAQPVRVIYAKLTSTGAYDVVATTPDLPLDRARSLAERLLPGNPPHDATVTEEIAHLMPPEGGHIVLRFSRYDWADGGRGDVYATDFVWLSDDDFQRLRGNAFAVVPRAERTFDVLTELPPVEVPERSAADDLVRITELRHCADAARNLAASAMAADPLLLIQPDERVCAVELFTLLLPPAVRTRLTFQTQAFRVPSVLPRVTLADRPYANLRDGRWEVLPNVEKDVPYALAGELIALVDDPERLYAAHELYEEAYDDGADLRTCVTRVKRLAELAGVLRVGDVTRALAALAAAEPPARAAGLRVLRRGTDAPALADALVRMIQGGAAGATDAAHMLGELDEADVALLTARITDALPVGAPAELVAELAVRCARAGDLPRLVVLLERGRRAVAERIPLDAGGVPNGASELLRAVRETSSARHDTAAAARLLAAAAAAAPALRGTAARDAIGRICRDAVEDALERTAATPAAVHGMLALQDHAVAYHAAYGQDAPLSPLLADEELSDPAAARLQTVAGGCTVHAAAVLGAALVVRADMAHRSGDAEACGRAAATAARYVQYGGRELARQLLQERGVREQEVAAWPGAEALAEVLGVNTQQAGVLRRMREALHTLSLQPERGVQELAAAVLAAHTQRLWLGPGMELWGDVMPALRNAATDARVHAGALEICVELLALVTDPAHLHELEDAAGDGVLALRLRRLDRSIVVCRAAEDESRYERYARAIEADDAALDPAARDRLRAALGTRTIERRLMRMVSGVVERSAP